MRLLFALILLYTTLVTLLFVPQIWADDEKSVIVDVPLFEVPFNFSNGGFNYPSMRQSLAISTSYYENVHDLLGPKPDEASRWYGVFRVLGFDFVSFYLPLGTAWLHEEWHRAVMSNRNMRSFNDVYKFPLFQELIAVSHVQDSDLVRLKRDHPADQVRLSAAGMESEIQQNLLIEKHHFYNGAKTFNGILLWMNNISVIGYLSTCASTEADTSTNKQNKDDGSSISKRDFTGLDCTAWVYDLFRPNEPYATRGAHPSGRGMDRYIKWSDLSNKEQDFLELQASLSYLNFVDPFLFRFHYFTSQIGDETLRWNAKLSHTITSFGYTVDALVFLDWQKRHWLFKLHNGFNDKAYFPGVTLEWLNVATPWDKWTAELGLTLWPQPKDQMVEASASEWMTAAMTKLNYQINQDTTAYVGLEGKSPGWLTGNVYLDSNVTIWNGLILRR